MAGGSVKAAVAGERSAARQGSRGRVLGERGVQSADRCSVGGQLDTTRSPGLGRPEIEGPPFFVPGACVELTLPKTDPRADHCNKWPGV